MPKFRVKYRLCYQETLDAESLAAAEEIAEQKSGNGFYMPDPDDIDTVDYDIVEIHPVTRGGQEIWTSDILKTDIRGHRSELLKTPLFENLKTSDVA